MKRKAGIKNTVNRVKRKIKILEVKQNPKITGNGENKQKFCEDFIRMAFINKHAKRIVYNY
jgi:hypothetical protein